MGPDGEITRLISDWQRGAPGAENALFNALYQRLHTLALQCLRGERPDRAPGATSLVHGGVLALPPDAKSGKSRIAPTCWPWRHR